MRVWDIPPAQLCRQHLLGQHNEIHRLWTVLTQDRSGYANHPETMRWRGRLRALYFRHETTVTEMLARGYNHNSPLNEALATGEPDQQTYVDTIKRQRELLKEKQCDCSPSRSS